MGQAKDCKKNVREDAMLPLFHVFVSGYRLQRLSTMLVQNILHYVLSPGSVALGHR
jgi:hypothetical protein